MSMIERIATLGELVPCGGGDPVPLLKPKLLIGRRGNCDIMLDLPNVSGQHCLLELLNGYWFVRDLRSRNGIKVNGQRCDSKWLLPKDELSIAKQRYEILYQPAPDAPPPPEDDPFAVSLMEKAGLLRHEAQERRVKLPPASRPMSPPRDGENVAGDEDQVVEWLTDDDA